MLQDICREGRCPRRLRHWGLLDAHEVEDVNAAFSVWKMQRRVTMPALVNAVANNITTMYVREAS